jgi:hypothetical protein
MVKAFKPDPERLHPPAVSVALFFECGAGNLRLMDNRKQGAFAQFVMVGNGDGYG